MNEADESKDSLDPGQNPTASPDSSAATTAALPTVARGARMRRDLLAKLPPLPTRAWTMDHWINLGADSDVRVVLDLDADAFLAPLEEFVPSGRK